MATNGFSLEGGNLELIYDKNGHSLTCPICQEKMLRVFIKEKIMDIIIFAGWGQCGCSIHDIKGLDGGR